jgi:hypothetical protein
MASQLHCASPQPSPARPRSGGATFPDEVSDSGYGGSLSDGSSSDYANLLEHSSSSASVSRHLDIPADRQQELYSENCRLLAGSINDTKEILKVWILDGLCNSDL